MTSETRSMRDEDVITILLSQHQQWAVGPFASLVDRARDAFRSES